MQPQALEGGFIRIAKERYALVVMEFREGVVAIDAECKYHVLHSGEFDVLRDSLNVETLTSGSGSSTVKA